MKLYLKTFLKLLFGVFSINILIYCTSVKLPVTSSDLGVLYQVSIQDACYPAKDEAYNRLTKIDKNNEKLIWKEIEGEKYLLAVSWKLDTKYYKNDSETGFYNTGSYPIWVTVAPELQQKYQALRIREADTDLRLKQLLGLPPNAEKKYFVEFWVKPEDLFRPCPDAEVNDTKCASCFPENVTKEHKEWIQETRNGSYYHCELYQNYPWTQLGYTYDWNAKNETHFGLSEFVIGKNKNIVVHKFYPTSEYFQE